MPHVGEVFGQGMGWTVRGKGDFQPERFVPVKRQRLRSLLQSRVLRAALWVILGHLCQHGPGGMWKTSGLREVAFSDFQFLPFREEGGAHTLLS